MKRLTEPLLDRFFAAILCDVKTHCWVYRGSWIQCGYGMMTAERARQRERIHRIAYRLFVGPIPDRYLIHHQCENKLCCNPAHLEAMPMVAHIKHHSALRTPMHCPAGHAYTDDNIVLSVMRKRGAKVCLTCKRLKCNEDYEKHKTKRLAAHAKWRETKGPELARLQKIYDARAKAKRLLRGG